MNNFLPQNYEFKANYNCEDYIAECIESVIGQTYKEIELILVNDGSTDSSLKICEDYEKIDKRIKVYSYENSGVSKTREIGYKKSSGKYEKKSVC